jgi:hypothetical protein
MIRHEFSDVSPPIRRRPVYGPCHGFLSLDQGVGRRERRRRAHRRCIGCEESTRKSSSPQIRPRAMRREPTNEGSTPIFWFGRIASSRPGRAVFDRTARKAEARLAVAPSSPRTRRFQAAPCPAEHRATVARGRADPRHGAASPKFDRGQPGPRWRYGERSQRVPRERAQPAWAETASAGSVARPFSAAR